MAQPDGLTPVSQKNADREKAYLPQALFSIFCLHLFKEVFAIHPYITATAFILTVMSVAAIWQQRHRVEKDQSTELVSFFLILGNIFAALSLVANVIMYQGVGLIGGLGFAANLMLLPALLWLYKTMKDTVPPIFLEPRRHVLTPVIDWYSDTLDWVVEPIKIFMVLLLALSWPILVLFVVLVLLSRIMSVVIQACVNSIAALPTLLWMWLIVITFFPTMASTLNQWLWPLTWLALNLFWMAFVGLAHHVWQLAWALWWHKRSDTGSLSFWKVLTNFLATLFWFLIFASLENFWQATAVSGICTLANLAALWMYLVLSSRNPKNRWWNAYHAGGLGELFYQLWRYLRYPALR